MRRTDSFEKILMLGTIEGIAVKTIAYNAGGMGLIPGQGSKIPHATEQPQKYKNRSEKLEIT